MKDSIFYYRIGTQRECECPGGACNTSSSLQQRSSKGIGLGELPKCSTFFCRSTGTRMDKHMKFPQDIMRQYCRHQVKMISVQPSNGDIIHIALRLQLAARVFLRPSAIMKVENLLHGGLLVSHDHLELESVLLRNKEVKLNSFLGLLFDSLSNKEKAKLVIPFLGLPIGVEVGQFTIEAPPASSAINHLLQLRKALKGHGDGELNVLFVQLLHNLVAEEGAVHAHFDIDAGTGSPNASDAVKDELHGSIGIMDIARTGQHIKDLGRLGDSTEQGIVASLSFLLLVEPDRRAFGHSSSANDRSVEVHRQSGKLKGLQPSQQHLSAQLNEASESP